MHYATFILHVPQDAANLAEPLRQQLTERGCQVWDDHFTLLSGQSIRQQMQRGLEQAHTAILILSPAFFDQPWPPDELDGLLDFERDGHKVVISVWHEVDAEVVMAHFRRFTGLLAMHASSGLEVLADEIAGLFGKPAPDQADANLEESTQAEQEVDPQRFANFEACGRRGRPEDVDALMADLEADDSLVMSRLVDFALGLVHTGPGRQRIEYYLFNGTQKQRNYAALYFKRRHQRKILKQAVEAGCIDEMQAFSK